MDVRIRPVTLKRCYHIQLFILCFTFHSKLQTPCLTDIAVSAAALTARRSIAQKFNSRVRKQFSDAVLNTGENLARLQGESVLSLQKEKVLLELAMRLD